MKRSRIKQNLKVRAKEIDVNYSHDFEERRIVMKKINLCMVLAAFLLFSLTLTNMAKAKDYPEDEAYTSIRVYNPTARPEARLPTPDISIWSSPESEGGDNTYYSDQRVTVYYRVENATHAYYMIETWAYGTWGWAETPLIPLTVEDGVAEGSIKTFKACISNSGYYAITIVAENDEPPSGFSVEARLDIDYLPRDFTPTAMEEDVFDEVNARRGSHLRFDENLACAARNWAQFMCDEGFCDHEGPGNTRDSDLVWGWGGWTASAIECTAFSAESAVQRLMDSPGHEMVLTDTGATHMGVGHGDCGRLVIFVGRR